MLKHIGRHGVRLLSSLIAVTILITLLVDLMPGDPAVIIGGEYATPDVVEHIRKDLDLDRSAPVRYANWVGNLSGGDLGESVRVKPGGSVWALIGEALPATASIALLALLFAAIIAVPVGFWAASHRGSAVDRVIVGASSVSLAIPSFIFGLVLVALFAINRSWLPATGYAKPSEGLWEWLKHLLLPAFALAHIPMAELIRQVRGALIDTFELDYVRTARSKGLSRRSVLWKHAGKGAAVPVVTIYGLQAASLLGGAIVVERIFAISGFGSLAFEAVSARDIPLIQGVVLVGSMIVVSINFLVDVLHAYLSPRSR